MRVLVTVEQRFIRCPDGSVWSPGAFDATFWNRYLQAYDEVNVVARQSQAATVPAGWKRADTPGVRFTAVPFYVGPAEYLRQAGRIRRSVQAAFNGSEAVILRVASPIAACLEPILRRLNYPYGLEVVGDPHDTFVPGAVRHPMRPAFRWWFARQLRRQCAHACAVAYVTSTALQRRYPSSPGALTVHYSSAQLDREWYASAPRVAATLERPAEVLTVASLEQMYKGTDLLLRAVSWCISHGQDLRLTVVGDGKHREELVSLSAGLGLSGKVRFTGYLPDRLVLRAQLDRADLFVLPSRTEGLPRAMLEAMARGLPCIGTQVGGIPELLQSEDLVPRESASALAQKMTEVLSDPPRMQRMSARNLERAREYADETLAPRRLHFYRFVQQETQRWLDRQPREPGRTFQRRAMLKQDK